MKKMGYKDFLRMPKKLHLLMLFISVLPFLIKGALRGEETEFIVKWDGKEDPS